MVENKDKEDKEWSWNYEPSWLIVFLVAILTLTYCPCILAVGSNHKRLPAGHIYSTYLPSHCSWLLGWRSFVFHLPGAYINYHWVSPWLLHSPAPAPNTSFMFQPSSHTVPHSPFRSTSTRPSQWWGPLTSRTLGEDSAKKGDIGCRLK